MKKKIFGLFLAAAMISTTLLSGCSDNAASKQSPAPNAGTQPPASSTVDPTADAATSKPKVCLLVPATLGDKSFLDSAASGLATLKEQGYETKVIEMGLDQTKWVPTMTDISSQDYDIIVTGPWQVEDALAEVAPQFPDQKYLLFDTEFVDENDNPANPDNICSILYDQSQLAFLTGALAAKVTASTEMPLVKNTNVIGFVGGMDIPVITDYMVNYIKGAQYVNPDIKVTTAYVGDFADSATGKEMALAQYNNQNADIVFQCASQSGLGCIEAAKVVDKYVIGVDSDQALLFQETDAEMASHIITSAEKRVGDSVVAAVKDFETTGLPWGGSVSYGLDSSAIGLSDNDIYQKTVPQDIRDYVADLQGKILSGEVKVESAMNMSTEEINAVKDSARP